MYFLPANASLGFSSDGCIVRPEIIGIDANEFTRLDIHSHQATPRNGKLEEWKIKTLLQHQNYQC
jgi:hypothetical protein